MIVSSSSGAEAIGRRVELSMVSHGVVSVFCILYTMSIQPRRQRAMATGWRQANANRHSSDTFLRSR